MRRIVIAVALGATTAGAAIATDSHPTAQPLRHDSAFADYKPWRDLEAIDWRQANDAVREAASQAGGHAGHASAAAPPPSPGKPRPAPRAGRGARGHRGAAR